MRVARRSNLNHELCAGGENLSIWQWLKGLRRCAWCENLLPKQLMERRYFGLRIGGAAALFGGAYDWLCDSCGRKLSTARQKGY